MEELEKRIKINDNRFLIYKISKGYVPSYTIMEGFIENGELEKTYSLSQWDDYGFSGWLCNDDDCSKLSFTFDVGHPLFLPLIHLLNYEDELIIEDDDTREDNKKYMKIHREENKIHIDFIDNIKDVRTRFHVYVKNIMFDGRSKIDQENKDTKKRLSIFFREIHSTMVNDYPQITLEEYLLRTADNYSTIRKVFKKEI